MKKGLIINIEGTNEAGKTTQVELLCKRLEAEGYSVLHHKFPTENCVCSAPAYAYLHQEIDITGMTGIDASILFLADMICWGNKFIQARNEGKIVILERYYNGNIIHQAARDWEEGYPGKYDDHPMFKLFAYQFANNLKGIVQKSSLPIPDKVVYLHASPELTESYRTTRNNGGDLFEISRVHQILASKFGLLTAEREHWDVIDEGTPEAPLSVDEIHEQVYTLVKEAISELRKE